MKSTELESKWSAIALPQKAKFSYQRIDSLCIPELRVGLSSQNKRCLILKINSKLKFEFKQDEKQNLKTYYDNDEKSIVIELKDAFYNQLFTDLVISLYQLIKDVTEEEKSTELFINTVDYWSDFLKSKRQYFLSEEEIQGLYGELVFLEHLIDNSTISINQILKSWRGPYSAIHDFQFTDKNIEVKTKHENSNVIFIASEKQLEPEYGKELELVVVNVLRVNGLGDTLKQAVDRIRLKVLNMGGESSIISDALAEKKLSFANLIDYESYLYKPKSLEFYDCVHVDFPKLISRELNNALHNISYNLTLNLVDIKLLMKTIDLR
jgi:hypothetical protein